MSAVWLHAIGAALVVARLVHPFGLTMRPGVNPTCFVGTTTTWIGLAIASVLSILQYV